MSSVSFWGVGKSPMSVIPYGWVPSEKTHTRYLSLTTSYLPTPFLWTRVVMRQHGRWGLISTNRVTGKSCFIGVTVGTRTERAAKCLCPLVPVVSMISFYNNNNTVSGSNNDFDNTVAPWWCKAHACHWIKALFQMCQCQAQARSTAGYGT